jgi:hypothetical protein
MFRASSCPSSGATTTAVAASGLPSERGDSSAVGRGRAGRPARPRPTAKHSRKLPRRASYQKPEDGGGGFFQHVVEFLPYYTVSD